MNYNIDLKSVESNAWQTTFQDGLWDLFLGMILLAFTVHAVMEGFPVSDNVRLTVFVAIEMVALLTLSLGKKLITVPRIGQVKFGARRRAKLNKVKIVTAVAVMLGADLWVVMRNSADQAMNMRLAMPAIWAISAVVAFGLVAYLFEYRRFYFIGILYAATIPALRFLETITGPTTAALLAFGVPALIVLIMGEISFVSFLRATPVPKAES